MTNQLLLPKEILVGYQKRQDTYEDKLGFITFKNKEGKIRLENTWVRWKDESIPSDIFLNEPTEGFVLNKNIGGQGWQSRTAKIRVYDPRGFEIEITIENLLYILTYNNSITGKGLEGSYVYAWENNQIVLVPTKSPDYQKIIEYNNFLDKGKTYTAKDLIVGKTYIDKEEKLFTYLGCFKVYDYIGLKSYEPNKVVYKKNKYSILSNKVKKEHFFYCHDKNRYNKIKGTNSFSTLKNVVKDNDSFVMEEYYKELFKLNRLHEYKSLFLSFNESYLVQNVFKFLNDKNHVEFNLFLYDENKEPVYKLVFDKNVIYNKTCKTELFIYKINECKKIELLNEKKDNSAITLIKSILFKEEDYRSSASGYKYSLNLDEFLDTLYNEENKELIETLFDLNLNYLTFEKDISLSKYSEKNILKDFNYILQ